MFGGVEVSFLNRDDYFVRTERHWTRWMAVALGTGVVWFVMVIMPAIVQLCMTLEHL